MDQMLLDREIAPVVEKPAADVRAADPQAGRQRVLMCAPHHFGVEYVINPWMENHIGASTPAAAAQWENLRRHLAQVADIALATPQPGLPDMVFTANAGMVIGRKAVASRFRSRERQPEGALFRDWFHAAGFDLAEWPDDVFFEGAGDALLDRGAPRIWCGHGWRTGDRAPALLQEIYGRETVGLRLVDPRFYHLDTCFCPLEGGWLMYYPAAFDAVAQAAIEARIPLGKRIAVGETDALGFACNAVNIGRRVYLNAASDALKNRLRDAGFAPVVTPLSEFMKAGGAAKCLTLRLVEA